MLRERVTRRRIAFTTGALATAAGGYALATQPADASVTMGEVSVPEATFATTDGELAEVYVYLDGEYSYQVATDPAETRLYLLVGTPDGGDPNSAIEAVTEQTTAAQATQSFELGGAVTAAGAWAASDFAVPDGQSDVTVPVPIGVRLLVYDDAGDVLVSATATGTAPVVVSADGTVEASIGASGTLAAVDDSGDPTPTPPA